MALKDSRGHVLLRLLLVAYTLAIIGLSLTPGLAATALWKYDKVGHFLTYAGLAFVAMMAFDSRRSRIYALLGAVTLGAILEYAQSFVPGRDMSLNDEIANTLGVMLGSLIYRYSIRQGLKTF